MRRLWPRNVRHHEHDGRPLELGPAGIRYPAKMYAWCMARTNIDIDEQSCRIVMDRFHLRTKKEAVNLALALVAGERLEVGAARALRGSGWDGDLDELRATRS